MNLDNDKSLSELQTRLITELETKLRGQEELVDCLLALLRRYTSGKDDLNDSREVDLFYAIYEVTPRSGHVTFLAVCIDNPFLYAVAESRTDAASKIKEMVGTFYRHDSDNAEPGPGPENDCLRGIEIPNCLPEEF